MAVYVDPSRVHREDRACGLPTCHLATDGELDELHGFAARIGVPRMAFHRSAKHPHYDLGVEARVRAVGAGAVEVSSKDLVRKCFLKR